MKHYTKYKISIFLLYTEISTFLINKFHHSVSYIKIHVILDVTSTSLCVIITHILDFQNKQKNI